MSAKQRRALEEAVQRALEDYAESETELRPDDPEQWHALHLLDPKQWEDLRAEEQRLREVLGKLGPRDGSVEERKAAARAWFAAVAGIMKVCVQYTKAEIKFRPPIDVYFVLGDIAENLGRGIVPEFVSDVALTGKKGGATPPRSTGESRDIAYATAYIQAAKAGVRGIPPKNYIHKIQTEFGVTRFAAQRWGKETLPEDLSMRFGDPDFGPRLLLRVSEAGARYKVAGRSKQAIDTRGAKA